MKQYITREQLEELPDEQIYRLNKWWKESCTDGMDICHEHGRCYVPYIATATQFVPVPLMTIGMMFEFLGEKKDALTIMPIIEELVAGNKPISNLDLGNCCDALWESVKGVLEK